MAPLFLKENQEFVWGPDLKADLAQADAHFDALPDKEKARGLFLLASKPPDTAKVIAGHWDRFLPGLRARERPADPPGNHKANREIVQQSNEFIAAAAARRFAAAPVDEPDHLIIQRFIPKERGKWRMFSKEFEEENDRAEKERRK